MIPWRVPIRVPTPAGDFLEWFRAGGVDLASRPYLMVKHRARGGREVGTLVELRNTVLDLQAIFEVALSDTGDGLLALLDRWGEVPCSAGFSTPPGGYRRHDDWPVGIERVRAELYEVAVVPAGMYPGARIRRYGRG